MTTPAPYTPATLARVRNGASAEQLGWAPEWFNTVCRKHGIGRVVSAPALTPIVESKPALTAAQAKREPRQRNERKTPAYEPPKVVPKGEPRFDAATGLFTVGDVCVPIPGVQQCRVLAILFNLYCSKPHEKIYGEDLAQRLGTGIGSIASHVSRINQNLWSMGFRIDGHKGRGGGYQLKRVEPKR